MTLIKYDQEIIQMYVKHLEKYLNDVEKIECSNLLHKDIIIYNGFKTIIQLLSLLHLIKMPEDQINSYLEKCNILYVEYTEQVYLKNTDNFHTPTMFVYNVLIGNISLNAYTNSEKQNINLSGTTPFMRKITIWNEIVLYWGNVEITNIHRIYFIQNFLQAYLLLFTKDSCFELFRVFKNIQSCFDKQTNICDKYTYLLTSFYSYISKSSINFDKKYIEDLIFEKFVRNKEQFEEMFNEIENMNDMDNVIEWIFSS